MVVETGVPFTVGGLNFHDLAAAITRGAKPKSSTVFGIGVTFPLGSTLITNITSALAGASGMGGMARLIGFRPPSTKLSGTICPFCIGPFQGCESPKEISVTTGLRATAGAGVGVCGGMVKLGSTGSAGAAGALKEEPLNN